MRAASFLLGVLAALAVMAACGGESSPASTATVVPATSQPTPTEIPATPTPAEPPQTPESAPTIAASIPPTASESPTAVPEPTEVPIQSPPPTEPSDSSPEQEVAEIRQIVEAYWAALNEYDVDHAVTMLEPGYRAQEEDSIRSDIGRMRLFRVKLEVSEETPPTLNADGDYETYLAVKTPVDARRVLMVFRRIDTEWWIIFSEEIE